MVEDGSLKVLKICRMRRAVIAEGEVNQLTAQRQITTSQEKYLDIIGSKTAGAVCSGLPDCRRGC
jgi:octaprenyl-diphosphate synthase